MIVKNGLPGLENVESSVLEALKTRIQTQADLTADEIRKVSALDKSLFPKTMEIPEEATESLRLLCTWSRCELRPAREIQSHRRFIGPVIVFLKRVSWPFIRFHLKDTFESMELFHSKLIYAHARQVFEIEQMKKNLPVLP